MRTKEEILKQVDEVMEEYVAPNVAMHGGQINILNFNEETGILHTQMSGSCSGCASSTATLQMGVESTLMHFVPEIKGVTSEDDPMFNDPYYMSDPSGMGLMDRPGFDDPIDITDEE
jgi:Fe-S cluster biogenesis protein NfuA